MVKIKGQQKKQTTIVSVYRPNPGGNTSGDMTVWRQKRNLQIQQTPEDERMRLVDPREETLSSIKMLIKKKQKNGGVVMDIDTNESKSEKSSKYSKLVNDLNIF